MEKQLKTLIGIPLWALAFLLRFVFMVIGVFFVPLTLVADGQYRTPPLWRPVFGNVADAPWHYHRGSVWKKYVWMAWRNPVEGLDSLLTQPIPEVMPNPDVIVRLGTSSSASRWMTSGIFWEYWYLAAVGERYFEFRIGWKFVDGNYDFVPTIQLGIKK